MKISKSCSLVGEQALPCGHTTKVLIEYAWNSPEYYDGVSEVACTTCNRRWGRWSGNELMNGEIEPKYGKPKTSGGA